MDVPGERDRCRTRLDATATHTDVNLDEDPEGDPGRGGSPGERVDLLRVVDDGDRIGACAERDESAELDRSYEGVRDQEIADPRCRQHLGLAELGTSGAYGAGRDELPGDDGTLVALGMKAATPSRARGSRRSSRRHCARRRRVPREEARRVEVVQRGPEGWQAHRASVAYAAVAGTAWGPSAVRMLRTRWTVAAEGRGKGAVVTRSHSLRDCRAASSPAKNDPTVTP